MPTRSAIRSPFATFERADWARLSAGMTVPLSQADLPALESIDEEVSLDDIGDIYVPLARLLTLHVRSARALHDSTRSFLRVPDARAPFVIGLAGSVAAGKSTTARILRALLSLEPEHPEVALISTDGFLYPNRELESRGLMKRKGFPESYDLRRLLAFVADLASGCSPLVAPKYSHLSYDIVPGEVQTLERQDIVLIEGLTLLQGGTGHHPFVSDFLDFMIFVDAPERWLRLWYVQRFLKLREAVFRDPRSYFHRYADLSVSEATREAERIWDEINGPNLHQNILPTRERAHLILEKGEGHRVRRVRLRSPR